MPFSSTRTIASRRLQTSKDKNDLADRFGKARPLRHRLRHKIAARSAARLDLFGRAYDYIESKTTALAEYWYSVAIENSRSSGYFTEKILDCFINKVVPIYWGDPDIGEHFDISGIIVCQSEDDIVAAIEAASQKDYEARRSAIEDNFQRAHAYLDLAANMANTMATLAGAAGHRVKG